MRSTMQVSRASTEIPMQGKSADVTISSDVVSVATEAPLDPQATSVKIEFSGAGDVRVRRDGGNPAGGTSGALWAQTGIMELNREEYELLKMVRDGASDGAIHITQMTGGRLR